MLDQLKALISLEIKAIDIHHEKIENININTTK